MDNPQEYEVESVTRARVHDKRGKKITWQYYVKWKGYDWNDSTWEPTDSFQGGSEHILESFWERIDTGGRDISDATAFKKGEELLVSGPPGRRSLKRKANPAKAPGSPSKNASSSMGVTISAPVPRKRRRVLTPVDDEQGHSKLKRSASVGGLKNGRKSARSPKRGRTSLPGSRKSAPKRLPSAGDSQLDADGETDPDVVEVEDELMQVSTEDAEEDPSGSRHQASGSTNESEKIAFEDLEHFYSGKPIDIDEPTNEQVATEKPETRAPVPSPPPANSSQQDDVVPDSQEPASPTLSSPDPLFDSPSRFPDGEPEIQGEHVLPRHRARAARPLVKLIDTTTLETTSRQTRITTKARLLLNHSADVSPGSGPSHDTARRGRKPGPGRSSSGLINKNRSSLLTATKGTLKSVKGKFAGPTAERDQPDEIEEAPATRDAAEGNKLLITSWSDEDKVVDQGGQAAPNSQPDSPPSGEQLLKLARYQADPESLLDYEDATTQAQEVRTQKLDSVSAPTKEEPPDQSLVEVAEGPKAGNDSVGVPSTILEAGQQASESASGDPSPSTDASPPDEAVRKNIELAKEQLFPSAQMSFSSFSTAQPSFQTTIFGPLYQGHAREPMGVTKNELSTTFKVTLGDGVELPLALKDCSEIKARISDILIGNSTGGKVALFYSAVDALAMVSTFKSDGTARVVLDPDAEMVQQEHFSALLQRFELSHTLIAPVGKEVCVLYSSENADIAEKLGAPKHLRGLSRTLLISYASIENQLAYVAAVMKATALNHPF